MNAPTCGGQITGEWLEEVLARPLGPLNVHSFSVRGVESGGSGQWEVVQVRVTAAARGEADPTARVLHLAAKFVSGDPVRRELTRRQRAHLREFLMYTEIVPSLNQHQAAAAPHLPHLAVPRLLYAKCDAKEYVLLMEDVQTQGYRVAHKLEGLDGHQLREAVGQVARLHALSYVLHKADDFTNKYSGIGTLLQYLKTFKPIMDVLLSNCIIFLKLSPKTSEFGKKIDLVKKTLIARSVSCLSAPGVTCLLHGDLWTNNLVYRYSEADGSVEDVRLLHLGCCSLGSPLFDLQYLVHSSTSRAVRTKHLEEALCHYHATFTAVAAAMGAPLTHWTYDRFKAEWDSTYVIGFCTGVALTQITLSRHNLMGPPVQPSVVGARATPLHMVGVGVREGLARVAVPVMISRPGGVVTRAVLGQLVRPILAELSAATNSTLNSRLLDLVEEASEKGLFDQQQQTV